MQGLSCSEVDLNDVDVLPLTLQAERSPAVALFGVVKDVVDEVPRWVKSDEATRRSTIAGLRSYSMTFPSTCGEVLHGVVHPFLLQVCFLEEHDGIPPETKSNLGPFCH